MADTNIAGLRFGKLVVLGEAARVRGQRFWAVRCDCGAETTKRVSHVRAGRTKSCSGRCGSAVRTHGLAHTRLWAVWKAMKQRCGNPNTATWHRYGARGITFTPEWKQFEPFRDWALANGYSDDLELDRIDNNGSYTPENCRFVTHKANGNNKENTVRLVLRGKRYTIRELADRAGLEFGTIATRLRRGWSVERAISPVTIARKGNIA